MSNQVSESNEPSQSGESSESSESKSGPIQEVREPPEAPEARKATKQTAPDGTETKRVCLYYANGRCAYGDKCDNLHLDGPNRKDHVPPCSYYQTNSCQYGKNCLFRHVKVNGSNWRTNRGNNRNNTNNQYESKSSRDNKASSFPSFNAARQPLVSTQSVPFRADDSHVSVCDMCGAYLTTDSFEHVCEAL